MDCSKPSSPKTKLWAEGTGKIRLFTTAACRFFIAGGPSPGKGKHMNNIKTGALTRAAIIAALYAALTLLPILMPEAVPALAVGCLLSNILGGCTIFDIVFGTLATLLAAICTRALRKNVLLASAMPVLFNGVIVGAVVHYCYAPVVALPLCMLFVALGEAVACMLVGRIVLRAVQRIPEKLLHG